ncbi:hypothetical protein BDV96DRAFT_579703 [Lophiotrema nucula]|uniref:Uncharacterized protein n=1 Tax=Lophiotrema nucula TaxID=690887 RepID=A0A6A5Z3U1_9PLEO|nr:hypothetical protein BDV96DRAFT_579703 [Lophiotrema nucula]
MDRSLPRPDYHQPAPSRARAPQAASADLKLPPLRSLDMPSSGFLSSSQRPSQQSPERGTATSLAHEAHPGACPELPPGSSLIQPLDPAPYSPSTWTAVNKPQERPQPEPKPKPKPVTLPSLAQIRDESQLSPNQQHPRTSAQASIVSPPTRRTAPNAVVSPDQGPNIADVDDGLSPPLAKKARLSVDRRQETAAQQPSSTTASRAHPKEPLSPAPSPDATCCPGAYQTPHSRTPSARSTADLVTTANDVSYGQLHTSASHHSQGLTAPSNRQLDPQSSSFLSTASHSVFTTRRSRRSVTFDDGPHIARTVSTTGHSDNPSSSNHREPSSRPVGTGPSTMDPRRPQTPSVPNEPLPSTAPNEGATSLQCLELNPQNVPIHDITWSSRACSKCDKTWTGKYVDIPSLLSQEKPNQDWNEYESNMMPNLHILGDFRKSQEDDYERWQREHDCERPYTDVLDPPISHISPPAEPQEHPLPSTQWSGSSAAVPGDPQLPQTDKAALASPSSVFSTPPPDVESNHVLRAPGDTEVTKYHRLKDGGLLSENHHTAEFLYSKKYPAPLIGGPLETFVWRTPTDTEGTKYCRVGEAWISENQPSARIFFNRNASAIERNLGDEMNIWDSSKITADGKTKARKRTQGDGAQ